MFNSTNWLSLYFIFILVYIVFIILNYFMFFYPPKSFKKDPFTNLNLSMNWISIFIGFLLMPPPPHID